MSDWRLSTRMEMNIMHRVLQLIREALGHGGVPFKSVCKASLVLGIVGIGASVFVFSHKCVSSAETKIIEAAGFRLVDASGKVFGELGIFGNSEPRLSLKGKDGKDRLVLSVLNDEANVFMKDQMGKDRVSINIIAGSPHISINDKLENPRVTISLPEGVGPHIVMNDSEGEALIM